MKKLKSQSGRSMVEMLGVLAIIGVLSVGGIAGYSLAMRRHRANGVVDLISKYALITYNQCQQKILNGETTGGSSGGYLVGCIGGELMEFQKAGIGDVPAGVQSVMLDGIQNNQTEGIDTVVIDVSFNDSKLCQAVGSVTGTGCNGNFVEFKIKQN